MKKNAFTLIELLAVIIIIGLIAVITIPKINESVDDAKKNIAKTSAYSYKKAVNEYLYGEQLKKNDIDLSGVYEINESGFLYNDDKTVEVKFDGQKPKGGYLSYVDNDLVEGCITMGKYKVEFSDGEVSDIQKGECEEYEPNIVFTSFTGKVLDVDNYFFDEDELPENSEFWIQSNDTVVQACMYDFDSDKTICFEDGHYDCGTVSVNSGGDVVCSQNGYVSSQLKKIQRNGFKCSIYSSSDFYSHICCGLYDEQNEQYERYIFLDLSDEDIGAYNYDGWSCMLFEGSVECN